MPARKRKVSYPPPRTATRQAPPPGIVGEPTYNRPTVVSIDLDAAAGRSGLSVGDRVRINGGGLYSGEAATIERFAGGVIPAAVVRTDAGKTRQVRTIDLEPIGREVAREAAQAPLEAVGAPPDATQASREAIPEA